MGVHGREGWIGDEGMLYGSVSRRGWDKGAEEKLLNISPSSSFPRNQDGSVCVCVCAQREELRNGQHNSPKTPRVPRINCTTACSNNDDGNTSGRRWFCTEINRWGNSDPMEKQRWKIDSDTGTLLLRSALRGEGVGKGRLYEPRLKHNPRNSPEVRKLWFWSNDRVELRSENLKDLVRFDEYRISVRSMRLVD